MARHLPRLPTPDRVLKSFQEWGPAVYALGQLGTLLAQHREEWELPQAQTRTRFIRLLLEDGRLRKVTLTSPFGDVERYVWEAPSVYAVALSLREGAYLSHGTAVFLHGLTDQVPKVVYLNKEQSPKPRPSRSSLTQAGIDRAFSREQRRTNLFYRYELYEIFVLSGMATGNLEVAPIDGPNGEAISVTKVERTLIDIAVRPSYAGGVTEVVEAYRRAKGRCSIALLAATLRQLQYVYPYHQAIGFYLERAGYPPEALERFQAMGIELDFYLAYGLPATGYDAHWRLRLPEGL